MILQGAKPVRLAAGAFLLCVRVVAGCAPCRVTPLTLGAAPQDPLTLKLRLDTNDAKASSVRRRRYALKVPAAHFYVEIVDRVPLPRCGGGGRGKGQMRLRLPLERICAQYGVRFFSPEKSKFVASTAKRQRGLQRGKPGSPLPCFASFCRSKRKAPAASGANYAFAKGFRRRQATTNWPPHKNCPLQKLPQNGARIFSPPLSRAAAFSPCKV